MHDRAPFRGNVNRLKLYNGAHRMQLTEGEDLAELLKRGPLPLDEAIAFFVQIAEGLEAAHEKGISRDPLRAAADAVGTNRGYLLLLCDRASAHERAKRSKHADNANSRNPPEESVTARALILTTGSLGVDAMFVDRVL